MIGSSRRPPPFQGTAVTVELARKLESPQLLVVVNKFPDGIDRDAIRDQVADGYKSAVVALLTLNNEMSRLGSGGLFCNRFPAHPFTKGLHVVARRVLDGPASKR